MLYKLWLLRPPSTIISVPVINELCSLNKNNTVSEMFSGLPTL